MEANEESRLNRSEEDKMENLSIFEKNLLPLEELPAVESPAVVCGKWGCVVS